MHIHSVILIIIAAAGSACSSVPDRSTADRSGGQKLIVEIPLPVTACDVTPIGDSGGVEMYSALLRLPQGYRLVFERSDLELTSGCLRFRDSSGGRVYGTVQNLTLGNRQIYGAPSAIEIDGRSFLYYVATDSLQALLSLERRELRGLEFGEAEIVSAPSMTLLSWPRFLACGDGKLALAYREGSARLVVSDDPLNFSSPGTITSERIAQPHVGRFGDGSLIYAFQSKGGDAPMLSCFSIQESTGAWGRPKRISEESSNVHDCTFLTRHDGDVDAYYIYPAGPHGFSLFRRAISRTGDLGPEQQLTDASVGDTTKPMAARLETGSIILTYARTLERAPQGWITQQQLFAFVLHKDARRDWGTKRSEADR